MVRSARLALAGTTVVVVAVGAALFLLSPRGPWVRHADDALQLPLARTPQKEQLAPPVPLPDESPATAARPIRDWGTRYAASKDYFSFSESALSEAREGDAAAQYFLSLALRECKVQLTLGAVSHSDRQRSLAEDVEASLGPGLQAMKEQDRQRIRANASKCERFRGEDFFDSRSVAQEQRSDKFWFDSAVAARYPLALMDRAANVAAQAEIDDGETTRQAQHEMLLADVKVAVTSLDPRVVARVGWLYTQVTVAREPALQGPAWLLAACELGYDCSQANPEIGYGCVESGTCNGVLTLAEMFQRDFGAEQFAKIYAASQDIVYRLKANDWDGLQDHLLGRR